MKKQPEAEALRTAVLALQKGFGHGGLSYLSSRLGMSPSALRKRLRSPTAGFDEPTMRAVMLVSQSKAENHPDAEVIESNQIGPFIIDIINQDGEQIPIWRVA